jgi:glycosyltransferase involved in cell wall biosynthesis
VYRNANTISGFLDSKFKLIFNRWLMKEVDAVVSVSEATLRDFSGIFNTRHQVAVPIGIDAEEISRSLLAVGSSTLSGDYLIFIGGLVPEKDPLGMLEIFGSLGKKNPHLQLVYLGSGHLSEALSSQIQQRGWMDKVRIIPNQENIFPLLSQAKALVMPSKIEGLPAVILEAMYCRVPVVAYGVGGIGEVLKSGKTGWCVRPGDQKGFVEAVGEVLVIDEGRKKLILDSGAELVNSDYSLSVIASRFERFYLQILE